MGTVPGKQKGKSMKWLKRIIWRWSIEGGESDEVEVVTKRSHSQLVRASRDAYEADENLSIQLYKAIGGKIVSFRTYDRKSDRNNTTVYIITDEQDFERELGKMITMESMKL